MSQDPDFLTTKETLELLRISRTSLYALMERGVIVPVKSSPVLKRPRLLFRREDVERLLQGQ